MATHPPLLLIFGGGDQANQVSRSGVRTYISGSTDLGRLLSPEIVRERLVVSSGFFRDARRSDFDGYPVIVNMITEAEHNAGILEKLEGLLGGVPGRVVNPPEAVLGSTRDQVAKLLAGIDGLIVPTTIRVQRGNAAQALADAHIQPPIIVRQAGTHGGKIIGLFDSIESAVDAMDQHADHIATEFVDFRGQDGLYRKFRVFFIGSRRVIRHMLISDSWAVHGHVRTDFMGSRPELIAEERAVFESEHPFPPEIERQLDAIRERMPLDFFGLDFAVTPDRRVILFEANATMSFMPNLFIPGFDYLRRCHAPAQAAFMELLGIDR